MNESLGKRRGLALSRPTGTFTLSVFLGLMVIVPGAEFSLAQPFATSGSLDLSQWNPDENRRIRLDGEWYFFDSELLSGPDVIERLSTHFEILEVPQRWSSETKKLDADGLGFGTYALKLRLPAKTAPQLMSMSPTLISNRIEEKLLFLGE